MKKLVSILFFFLYLTSFSGLAVNTSYCCGKVTSVKLSLKGIFNNYLRNQPEGCCNQTTHFYRIHEAQQASNPEVFLKTPVLIVPVLLQASTFSFYPDQIISVGKTFRQNSPPHLARIIPLFTWNDSYLI